MINNTTSQVCNRDGLRSIVYGLCSNVCGLCSIVCGLCKILRQEGLCPCRDGSRNA